MNQSQIDLIKNICDQMTKPYRKLLCTPEHEDIINQDGGEFMPIIVSILASTMATCVASFANVVSEHDDHQEKDTIFQNMLTLIAVEAAKGYLEKNNKGAMH